MTKNISFAKSKDKLTSAMKMMKRKNVSQMPVIDSGVVVGTITEKDVAHAFVLNENPAALKVQDVMENPMPTIDVTTKLAVISALLDAQSAIMVTKNGKPCGIISRADLLKVVKHTTN